MRDDQYSDLDIVEEITDFQLNRREFLKITGGGIFFLHNRGLIGFCTTAAG